MKKFLSVILALVLVLSLGTVAFAEGDVEPAAYEDMSTVTISKTYTVNGGVAPSEEFTFTITGVSVTDAAAGVTIDTYDLPTVGSVTLGGDKTVSGDVTITLPKYESVGIYTYEINEVAGKTAGVTYYGEPIKLVVTVLQDAENKIRVAAVHTETTEGEKSNTIENVYEAGSLTVNKTVTGNLGDLSKYFDVTVTLTGDGESTYADFDVSGGSNTANPTTIKVGEATKFLLKHDETISIANIPAGVAYTVVEADYTGEGYDEPDYTDVEGKIAAATESAAKIVNNKDGEVDTGISLDSMPYVVLLTVAVLGVAVILTKKRIAE